MEWILNLFDSETLALLIPIIVIVGFFIVAAMRAHHKHQERIEKIKRGFGPDF
ncbi:hypothetical protein [Thalassotalea sp. PLHSN55]|uniref:hypothetical protein n=1 Tax=Thalassotalea sp. PLHSN55 TaxID=3435888 RepID=UPI003F83D42C